MAIFLKNYDVRWRVGGVAASANIDALGSEVLEFERYCVCARLDLSRKRAIKQH